MNMNLCEMFHSAVPLTEVFVMYAVLTAITVAAGYLRRKGDLGDLVGIVLLFHVALWQLLTVPMTRNWGVTVDKVNCLPMDRRISDVLLFSLNLALLFVSWISWRRGGAPATKAAHLG